jgi:membrane-associated phospholipid phosphatase
LKAAQPQAATRTGCPDACGRKPRRWDRGLASAVSFVASPPALVSLAAIMVAVAAPEPGAWKWASGYLGFLLWEVRRGAVSDLDIPTRRERFVPQLVTVTCMVIAWALVRFGAAPTAMTDLGTFFLLQSVALFGITLRWKISVHSATAAGVGMVVWFLSGAVLPLLLGASAVIWSRMRLDRHTVGQTIAGAAIGVAAFRLAM